MMELIKKIREATGAGVVDVKKALDEAQGDEAKAIDILKKKGAAKAMKKADREAREGLVATYVHSNGKIGSMVKVYCETDFVARNEEFHQLGRDIAMHVAAMSPRVLRPEDLEADIIEKEKEIWKEQLKTEKKPEAIWDKIMEGKEKKLREEAALLTQPFVKDPDKTVGELITEKIAKTGENIQLGEFARFEM